MTTDEKALCRLDKWLWSVRIYKTRSLASEACKSGRVKQNGQTLKPSKKIGPDDVLNVRKSPFNYTFKVLRCLEKRVSAKLVPKYMEDLTPTEEKEKLKVPGLRSSFYRRQGTGRPTKRDRRQIDKATDWQEEFNP